MLRLLIVTLGLLLTSPLQAQTDAEPEPAQEAGEDGAEVFNRVVPVFDPGSHTRPICAMGFTRDQSKLITVGEDYSIQVWSTTTGERLDILRLPPYGHEEGYNGRRWNIAAVSEDGKWVAVGGGGKNYLSDGKKSDRARLLLVDVAQRTLHRVNAPPGDVRAVAFSADGNRLAVSCGGKATEITIFSTVDVESEKKIKRRRQVVLTDPTLERSASCLSFSPDGSRLVSAHGGKVLRLWNVGPEKPGILKALDCRGNTTDFCWAPDGKTFARTWMGFLRQPQGFEIRKADGTLEREILCPSQPPLSEFTHVWSARFTGPHTLLINTHDGRPSTHSSVAAFSFDLKSNQVQRIFDEPGTRKVVSIGTVSRDRLLAAQTTSMGLDAVIFRVQDGTVVSRCGAESPVPTLVGWSAPGQPAGFAWSERAKFERESDTTDDLDVGFDLTRMEPVANIQAANYVLGGHVKGDWKISRKRSDGGDNELIVERKGTVVGTLIGSVNISSFGLIPRDNAEPLAIWSSYGLMQGISELTLSNLDGKSRTRFRPDEVNFGSFAPSSDGRFLITSTGTHRLCVYVLDGSRYPLLSVARVRGEWVAWTGDGYYAASPGGDKMIGWAVSNGPDKLATFYTAEKFAKHFRRPDLLRRAVELGSMKQALSTGQTRAPNIEQILPPQCELKLVKQTGTHVQIRATAVAAAKNQPVVAMRVFLDGKNLPAGKGYQVFPRSEKAETVWDIEIPSGSHELKLLARGDESSAESAALIVKGPRTADNQPALYRLCVGVDRYELPALNLIAAAKDAKDVYAGLEKYCVGRENCFGSTRGWLLVDQQATRSGVLKALAEIRAAAKPGDLVVVFFAGHGVKQKEEYYLLTHEANPNASLEGKSLSGTDLHGELANIECPVLLVMDACHSARGVKTLLRPATDELTRHLATESAGVTVLGAAMAHEVASSTEENGHFTAGLLKALKAGQGVPYDSYDHMLYVHHVYSVIFSEVRRATNGKQNPFFTSPSTAPLALRLVP